MIGEKGYCKHVSGEWPFRCYRSDVSSQSLCEDQCTSLTSCIGYHYGIKYNKHCSLIPCERSCPSGFSVFGNSRPIAASMKDLKADTAPDFVCYGKIWVNATNTELIL